MSFLIELPAGHYDRFVMKCRPGSAAYSILKNAIVDSPYREGFVCIQCDEGQAAQLLLAASKVYPTAIAAISQALTREL